MQVASVLSSVKAWEEPDAAPEADAPATKAATSSSEQQETMVVTPDIKALLLRLGKAGA